MDALNIEALPQSALLLIDSAPIILLLEGHPELAPLYQPLLRAQANLRFAVSTVTIAEVLTGPLKSGDEVLAERYRAMLESWIVVPLDEAIAASAARLRASEGLKLFDAVQLASAIAINADALITHDRDFAGCSALPILTAMPAARARR